MQATEGELLQFTPAALVPEFRTSLHMQLTPRWSRPWAKLWITEGNQWSHSSQLEQISGALP